VEQWFGRMMWWQGTRAERASYDSPMQVSVDRLWRIFNDMYIFVSMTTTKLTTINWKIFFQRVFTRFPHRNLMFCTNPT
jgi:hypothetical protein